MSDEQIRLAQEQAIDLAAKVNGHVIPKPGKDVQEIGVGDGITMGTFQDWVTGSGRVVYNAALVSPTQLKEMRQKDGEARALWRLLTLPIRSSLRESIWVEPEEGGAEKETEFANNVFSLPPYMGGMSTPKAKFMRQVLLALFDGFSLFEIVPYVPDDGPLKGKIALRKLGHRDPTTITFKVDENGGFDGAIQRAVKDQYMQDIPLPRDKCWYYAANEEENPFYGVSYFEAAWWHWDIKRRLYYISHLAAQMAAVSGRMGEIPPQASPAEISAFQKAVSDFAFNTSMTFPAGFKVDTLSLNTGFDFIKLIDHHNQQMSKSVLAKFLEDAPRQVLIENSQSDPTADFFVMSLEAIMDEIAENLTMYLMPRFIDWNFGTKKYPVFRWGTISDENKTAIKELFNTIATAQSSMWTPEFIRELEKDQADRYGFDIDYDAVTEREEQEREQMAQQQQFGGFGGPPPQQEQEFNPEEAAVAAARASTGAVVSLSDVQEALVELRAEREKESTEE